VSCAQAWLSEASQLLLPEPPAPRGSWPSCSPPAPCHRSVSEWRGAATRPRTPPGTGLPRGQSPCVVGSVGTRLGGLLGAVAGAAVRAGGVGAGTAALTRCCCCHGFLARALRVAGLLQSERGDNGLPPPPLLHCCTQRLGRAFLCQ